MIGDTPDNPIRCSKIADFTKCTMRLYLMSELLEGLESVGETAAQTGSAVHAGVAEFHKLQDLALDSRKKAAWEAMAAAIARRFPEADVDDCRLFLTPYMNDPRNINAKCVAVEETFNFTLDPHELDATQSKIYIQGTVDQIRSVNNALHVYDLKTGRPSGWDMIHTYAFQFAGYVVGALTKYENVHPGAIIRNRGYRTRTVVSDSPDGVYWFMPFSAKQCHDILDTFRLNVAMVRNGYISYGPGDWCSHCEFQGLQGCTDQYQKLQVRQRSLSR